MLERKRENTQIGDEARSWGDPSRGHQRGRPPARRPRVQESTHQPYLGVSADGCCDVLQSVPRGHVGPEHVLVHRRPSVGVVGQNIAVIMDLIGTNGSPATTSQSVEPARSASTTPAIHATMPHTSAAPPLTDASKPIVPPPDAS